MLSLSANRFTKVKNKRRYCPLFTAYYIFVVFLSRNKKPLFEVIKTPFEYPISSIIILQTELF